MPHAENNLVNGDNSSQFLSVSQAPTPSPLSAVVEYKQSENNPLTAQCLQHLESYPVVNDSIKAVKSNPYGKKSLNIADAGYKNFVAPVVPYAQRPYGYVAPYVNKADQLADGVLQKADERYPVLKEDTEKLKGSIVDLVFLPLRLAGQGKDYALDTYAKEYKKCGGDGYVAGGKAVITSGLIVTSDTFAWLANYFASKKDQAKEVAKEKTGN